MILIDTGALIALLDADDIHHSLCVSAARKLPSGPLLTTWPCFTEAMYLLGTVGGFSYQTRLWELYSSERVVIHDLSQTEMKRMYELMETYEDLPMDLADASLVALAESRVLHQIFTLDSHFYIYRLPDGGVLDVVP